MRWKQIEDIPKTFVLIFESGDEIASLLQEFAAEQSLAEVVLRLSVLFLTRSWAGSTGRRKSMIQPGFSTNKWNCFRSLATSPQGRGAAGACARGNRTI
jgi:hypothetical protein